MDDKHTDFSNHADSLPSLLVRETVRAGYTQIVLEYELCGYEIQSVFAKIFRKFPIIPRPAHERTTIEATIM
jgi:hypothetical protein